jgi:hypothetical protein
MPENKRLVIIIDLPKYGHRTSSLLKGRFVQCNAYSRRVITRTVLRRKAEILISMNQNVVAFRIMLEKSLVHAVRAQTSRSVRQTLQILQRVYPMNRNQRIQQRNTLCKRDFQYGAWAEAACEALLNCVMMLHAMLHEITDAAETDYAWESPRFWTNSSANSFYA